MPPKEINLNPGVLYCDGKLLGNVKSIELTELSPEKDAKKPYILGFDTSREASFTGTFIPNKYHWKKWLYMVFGRSNNWLKMHGYGTVRIRQIVRHHYRREKK